MTRSFLYTAIDGAPDGAPVFVLHERNGSLADARELGRLLGESVRRIAVRSARVQVQGANGRPLGCFWFIGPLERPELSTLGDGLYQLEQLLLEELERRPDGRFGLMGKGEGAVLALLAALVWHDRVERLVLVDAVWPLNLDDMPIETGPLTGLGVLLVGTVDPLVESELVRRGAVVRHVAAEALADLVGTVPA